MSDWHPIFYTSERAPGVWTMETPSDDVPFGRIELRRTTAGPRCKVILGREVMGWASLQLACERLSVGRLEQLQAGWNGPPNGRRALRSV
ncbi:hypothetical protein [Microbacterium paludicola]|uniref:hypothetical protein n=1 Tax=Microbacterium paludicola TaxID=300019 RepID=UPI00119DE15D|nr:hypothetical protein [Microbacterium paludicola]